MNALLAEVAGVARGRRVVLAVAAPVEGRAIVAALGSQAAFPPLWNKVEVRPGVDMVHLGVGKANAAGCLARTVAPHEDGVVLNVGIGGILPSTSDGPQVRGVVVAHECVFADEGILTPAGYQDVAEIGFPVDPECGSRFPCDPRLVEAARACGGTYCGAIATVSTCSATDALAAEIARRSGALAESMEGAACAVAARRMGVAFLEIRAMSNHTGDRSQQRWDVAGALASLGAVLVRLLE